MAEVDTAEVLNCLFEEVIKVKNECKEFFDYQGNDSLLASFVDLDCSIIINLSSQPCSI